MTDRIITYAQSGFDAPPALGPPQHRFAMASVDLDGDEAAAISGDLMALSPSPDAHAFWQILNDERGRATVAHLLGRMEGRYRVTVDDKRADLADIFFHLVLEPAFDGWRDDALADAARRLVEAAFLERMCAVGASSDALCVQIDGYVETLNYRAAPSLFNHLEFRDRRVPVIVQKFVMNNAARFAELVERRDSTVTETLPQRMAYAATVRHGRYWTARDPSSASVFEDGWIMGGFGLLYDIGGERAQIVPMRDLHAPDGAPARVVPIRRATTEDLAVLLAKVTAAAAVLAANHPHDGAYSAIARAIGRHSLPPSDDKSEGLATDVDFPDSFEAGDEFEKLLSRFKEDVGWGADRARRNAGVA